MAADAPRALEELLDSLNTTGMPAGGVEALSFTLPGSGEGAPRIVAKPCRTGVAAKAVPPAVFAAIEQHLLDLRANLYLERASEADLAAFSTHVVYPADFEACILYIYPLSEGNSPDYLYSSPTGLSVRDVARCIVATYRVIYAAERAAVGAAAHQARAGARSLNRGFTNGPFGIWGHDLRDLVLEGFTWAPSADKSRGGALLPLIGS